MAPSLRRSNKRRRGLPPGQKLLLLLLMAAVGCGLMVCLSWLWQGIVGQAMAHLPEFTANNAAHAASPGQAEAVAITTVVPPFELREELAELAAKVRQQADKPNLRAGIFVVEPDSGKFVDVDGRRAYPSASMIKLPVLIELMQAVDSGKVDLNQPIVIRRDLQAGGSGWLQWRPAGSVITLKECAELMIIISDNTATNMIIDLLGGKDVLNADFAKIGLTQTRINNPLPDLTGTNTTSPYDLAFLLGKIDAGQLVSAQMRAWMFGVMERNKIRTLLPQGLPPGTKIANKTGDIGGLVGDAAVITAKGGQRYIAAVAVERPWNDRRANQLIRVLSKEIYVGITGDAEGVKNVLLPAPKKSVGKRQSTPGKRHHRRRRRAH